MQTLSMPISWRSLPAKDRSQQSVFQHPQVASLSFHLPRVEVRYYNEAVINLPINVGFAKIFLIEETFRVKLTAACFLLFTE